ncbi:MAG: asparaginase [Firmicutes bacterium]|nr:asparaginase [Bacillota bacterium]
MSKHILMIETGGTFATDLKENGLRGIGNGSVFDYDVVAKKVKELDYSFESMRPFRILSENMTIPRLTSLASVFRNVDLSAYDAVIVTHGTDTLAYSVNLAAFLLGKIDIPFVFVSADRPLADPLSNGLDNFLGALDLINANEKGVFAVYRNGDGRVYVHRGGRLHQMDSLHPGFYSQNEVYYGEIVNGSFVCNEDPRNLKAQPDAEGFAPQKLCDGILQIHAYPGLDYSRFSLDGVEAILHFTYHTGMYCADGDVSNLDSLLDRCGDIPVVIVGGTKAEERYESALQSGHKLTFIDDVAGEAVYIKMILAFANMDRENALAYIQKDVLGEMLPVK